MAEWRSLHDLLAADSERVWDAIGASREYTGLPMKDPPKAEEPETDDAASKRREYHRAYSARNRYDTCACGNRKQKRSEMCHSCGGVKANRERRMK